MTQKVPAAQVEKAQQFKDLHIKGSPVVLYNIWDAGSANAVAQAGAKALATGSWSVAAAQGFSDGQAIPLDFLLTIVSRITASVAQPVSIDFEGGYAEDPETITANVERLIAAGAIGLNFEDQRVGGSGLHDLTTQQARIKAVRKAGSNLGLPLVINARTDLFLKEKDRGRHPDLLAEAKDRANAYAQAGADCLFVPGMVSPDLIAEICSASPLPVNVMMLKGAPGLEELAALGVARVSYGPGPYVTAMTGLGERYQDLG